MADITTLSEESIRLIQSLLDQARRNSRGSNPTGRPVIPSILNRSPDTQIMKTPSGGIPARSGTTPGSASCEMVRILPSTGELEVLPFESPTVYNLSTTSVPGDDYVNATLDRNGNWLVREGAGGGGGSDEKVKVTSNDTTEGYLSGKLVKKNLRKNLTLEIANSGLDEDYEIDDPYIGVLVGGVGLGFTVADSTTTDIVFSSTSHDTDGLYDGTSTIIIPTAAKVDTLQGHYLVGGRIVWEADAGATGRREMNLARNNGTLVRAVEYNPGTDAVYQSLTFLSELRTTTADGFTIQVWQNSGGNLDVIQAELWAVRLGD